MKLKYFSVPLQVCLFNITADPCELNNLVFTYPDVVRIMETTVEMYRSSAIPPGNKPIDPRGDPKYYGYVWTNWMDFYDSEVLQQSPIRTKKIRDKFDDTIMLSALSSHSEVLSLKV